MNIFTALGLLGVACYVASYALLQFDRISGDGFLYGILNVAAASLLLVSLVRDFNLASALTQVTWILIGLAGLARRWARRDAITDAPATGNFAMAQVHRMADVSRSDATSESLAS